ncbi:hypothetical protein BHF71_03860 [Vulcanibacillus modesticaldus]|uniref:Uncharacterized protein n=1 Tax=Vulcanibacillus modesticaldus TaxID=337097 RepID=A0A1D2YSJ0_9BACI|nr:DUF5359 family protein [Vulcanibacillus modesticaldus]OEF97279.1 hypothetical protein BHF71_03860 [Vulcanibacillus modesticaldus]
MEYRKRYLPFEDRFVKFSTFIERIIWRLLLLFLILLIVSQIILSFDEIRRFLVPVERIEGTMEYLRVLN